MERSVWLGTNAGWCWRRHFLFGRPSALLLPATWSPSPLPPPGLCDCLPSSVSAPSPRPANTASRMLCGPSAREHGFLPEINLRRCGHQSWSSVNTVPKNKLQSPRIERTAEVVSSLSHAFRNKTIAWPHIFYYYFYLCVCLYVDAMWVQCPWRPAEDTGLLELELTGSELLGVGSENQT